MRASPAAYRRMRSSARKSISLTIGGAAVLQANPFGDHPIELREIALQRLVARIVPVYVETDGQRAG